MKMYALPIMFESSNSSPFNDIFDYMAHQESNPYMIVRNCTPEQRRHRRRQLQGQKEQIGKANSISNGPVDTCNDWHTITLDLQEFTPEEITVKIIGENMISIEAKHEEKEDEHGYVYHHFVRKYTLPKGYDINNITSKLSTDGQLAITAPKTENLEIQSKVIKIEQTGLPASTIGDMVTPKQPTTVGKDIIDESVETAGKDLPN